jgi:hypothetical protein
MESEAMPDEGFIIELGFIITANPFGVPNQTNPDLSTSIEFIILSGNAGILDVVINPVMSSVVLSRVPISFKNINPVPFPGEPPTHLVPE